VISKYTHLWHTVTWLLHRMTYKAFTSAIGNGFAIDL
jgi:hypothetical protein